MKNDDDRKRAMAAVAAVARQSLAMTAKAKHSATAEMNHMARIAFDRLTTGAAEQGIGKAEISVEDLELVKEALRAIQNSGHLAFLRSHGDETDYQTIGRKVEKTLKPQQRRKA